MKQALSLGLRDLTIEEVFEVACEKRSVDLGPKARQRLDKGRAWIEDLLKSPDELHYGINTGFGSLKNVRIAPDKLKELQLNLIRSHAVGVGSLLPAEVVRAMMLLRAHTLSLGHSGVRPVVVKTLVKMLNHDIVPHIPSQGSVGASGDLAPLAHLALAMIGEGKVWQNGREVAADLALKSRAVPVFVPEAKEALALINGTQMMTAVGVLMLLRAEAALLHADIAAAMTLEASLGSPKAYDARVHGIRPHPGQRAVAERLRRLTAGSKIYKSHEDCDRVQDAYSLRCAPQVHGAAWDALGYVREVLSREINSVTDNPLVFPEGGEIISAGNFHGQPVSVAMDLAAIALTAVASISERRTFRLLSPALSELPAGLSTNPGLQSGLMMLQVTSASLVSECKTLSHPASVDSIPTWADQEDHVSMGAFAARKAVDVLDRFEQVLAIELICAAQGVDLRAPLTPSKRIAQAIAEIRKAVQPLTTDRVLAPDIAAATELLRHKKILESLA